MLLFLSILIPNMSTPKQSQKMMTGRDAKIDNKGNNSKLSPGPKLLPKRKIEKSEKDV